ncbi:hypothetical protein [Mesorhizobium sp.]|nr:hypothetical protein [Mesorhizobium sp.]
MRHGFDQPDDAAVLDGELELVLVQRLVVVGAHRQGLAANHRHPFGIGRAHNGLDGGGIGGAGRPKLDRRNDSHSSAPNAKSPPIVAMGGAGDGRTG